jgi:hypothetical protein
MGWFWTVKCLPSWQRETEFEGTATISRRKATDIEEVSMDNYKVSLTGSTIFTVNGEIQSNHTVGVLARKMQQPQYQAMCNQVLANVKKDFGKQVEVLGSLAINACHD